MRPSRTHAVSQDLATQLVKEPYIGLNVVAVEPNALVLDEHARLAIRRWTQSRAQARYRRIQIVARGVKLGMGPQLHGNCLAVDHGIHAQREPLGKCCRLFATPHLIRDGKTVAFGAKHAKHAHLNMADGVDSLNLARLE